jgi:hypothetical protein
VLEHLELLRHFCCVSAKPLREAFAVSSARMLQQQECCNSKNAVTLPHYGEKSHFNQTVVGKLAKE